MSTDPLVGVVGPVRLEWCSVALPWQDMGFCESQARKALAECVWEARLTVEVLHIPKPFKTQARSPETEKNV